MADHLVDLALIVIAQTTEPFNAPCKKTAAGFSAKVLNFSILLELGRGSWSRSWALIIVFALTFL